MDQLLLAQDGIWIYLTLFTLLLAGAVGFPIPEDLPLLLAGILLHEGRARLDLVFTVSYVAILLGDLLIFSVGRRFGPSVSKKSWFPFRISESQMRRIKHKLEKRSLLMIFIARHLFYLRTLTFLSCGALKMNVWKFLIADAASALISVPMVLGLGYLAAQNYEYMVGLIKQAKLWSLIVALLILFAYLIYARQKRKQSTAGMLEEEVLKRED